MSETAIKPCNCKSPYQDKAYGKGLRVCNKKSKTLGWRCTVCGADKAS